MKLKMLKRTTEKRCDARRARREGLIPAIIYMKGKPGEAITVPTGEFNGLLRNVESGHLSTTVFALEDDKGKQRRVIIKEIQYHPTTYNILHLDFAELHDDAPVKIKVPIEFTGVTDCAGVKQGGAVRQVIRTLRVCCLPKDIPSTLELDVRSMNVGESKRLAEINIPAGVKPMGNLNEVVAVIVKK